MQEVSICDPLYPILLKNIAQPPATLYVEGDVACLQQPQIAIVGSRKPTTLGLEHARYFAQQLANLGFAITSGMAIGIDGASHRGALSVTGGKTIAVLGHGMDMIYPSSHRELAQQICANGCLVSEFPVGTPLHGYNFPKRNRIISGLSRGVLVVEAALNSGSLITARYAVEQNREVFAIPGSINNPKKYGCHQLIRHGAKLVGTVNDVLEELVDLLNYDIHDKTPCMTRSSPATRNLTARQQQLLELIDDDATCVDVIAGRSGLDISAVSVSVLELELCGLITSVPGGYARKLV